MSARGFIKLLGGDAGSVAFMCVLDRTSPWSCSNTESACGDAVDNDCDGNIDDEDNDCRSGAPA